MLRYLRENKVWIDKFFVFNQLIKYLKKLIIYNRGFSVSDLRIYSTEAKKEICQIKNFKILVLNDRIKVEKRRSFSNLISAFLKLFRKKTLHRDRAQT